MTKTEAIKLFGTRPVDLARACNLSRQAIHSWPEELRQSQIDSVQAALFRRLPTKVKTQAAAACPAPQISALPG